MARLLREQCCSAKYNVDGNDAEQADTRDGEGLRHEGLCASMWDECPQLIEFNSHQDNVALAPSEFRFLCDDDASEGAGDLPLSGLDMSFDEMVAIPVLGSRRSQETYQEVYPPFKVYRAAVQATIKDSCSHTDEEEEDMMRLLRRSREALPNDATKAEIMDGHLLLHQEMAPSVDEDLFTDDEREGLMVPPVTGVTTPAFQNSSSFTSHARNNFQPHDLAPPKIVSFPWQQIRNTEMQRGHLAPLESPRQLEVPQPYTSQVRCVQMPLEFRCQPSNKDYKPSIMWKFQEDVGVHTDT